MVGSFNRDDVLFSLCGLNCSLCPAFIRKTCPGCTHGSSCALTCPFVPCSIKHGNITYCFECGEYPCDHYDGIDEYDSLISHKNQFSDMEKAKTIGIEKYHAEQIAKKQILDKLLNDYDDGRHDVFFCLAVNLLDLNDLKSILEDSDEVIENMGISKRASFIKSKLISCSEERGIELKLRRGRWI